MIELGKFTGEFVEECPEVTLPDGRTIYPSPIFSPGIVFALSKDNLDKYKGEVYAVVIRSESQYYLLGVSPLFKTYSTWNGYPDEQVIRTKNFMVRINEKDDSDYLKIEKIDGSTTITIDGDGVKITTKNNVVVENEKTKVEMTDAIAMTVGESKITLASGGNEIDVESPNLKLLGKTLLEVEKKNAIPSGSGALCAIPTCIFSGAIHNGNQAM